MALAPGTRLGPYAITASIGAGGMGEVYKATDTRLDRTVAIKVLPEHVASDPELRQRFEREAKTLAALSHPHICPVFDVGHQDAIDFLVMEYLEGETVEQRLKKGALPLDQALQDHQRRQTTTSAESTIAVCGASSLAVNGSFKGMLEIALFGDHPYRRTWKKHL
jgi:hypothetical protein